MFVTKSQFQLMDDWRNFACRVHENNKELLQLAKDVNENNRRCIALNEHLSGELDNARRNVDDLVYKLECLLCHATGGKLSKHTYDLRTMESAVTDYICKSYTDGEKDGYKKCAEEIFADFRKQINGYENIDIILDRMEKKYTGENDEKEKA